MRNTHSFSVLIPVTMIILLSACDSDNDSWLESVLPQPYDEYLDDCSQDCSEQIRQIISIYSQLRDDQTPKEIPERQLNIISELVERYPSYDTSQRYTLTAPDYYGNQDRNFHTKGLLNYALVMNQPKVVKILLEKARMEIKPKLNGLETLLQIQREIKPDLFDWYLSLYRKKLVEISEPLKLSFHAARHNRDELLKLIIGNDLGFDKEDVIQDYLISNGHPRAETIDFLLSHGATVKENALFIYGAAIRNQRTFELEIMDMLLDNGASIAYIDQYGLNIRESLVAQRGYLNQPFTAELKERGIEYRTSVVNDHLRRQEEQHQEWVKLTQDAQKSKCIELEREWTTSALAIAKGETPAPYEHRVVPEYCDKYLK